MQELLLSQNNTCHQESFHVKINVELEMFKTEKHSISILQH